LKATQQNR